MEFHSLRDAFLGMRKIEQIDREIAQLLSEKQRRVFVPYITRSRNTTNDEDVITLEKARELARWFDQEVR